MITPVKDGGWDEEDELKSDEMNAFQERLLKALDGVDGGTYELQDDLVFDGPGSVVIANDLTVEAGATLDVDGDLELGGTTDITGQFNVQSGADINVKTGAEINLQGTSQLDVEVGAFLNVTGIQTLAAPAELRVTSGAKIRLIGSNSLDVENGADLNVKVGGDINLESGADINVGSGAKIAVTGTGQILLSTPGQLKINDAAFGGYHSLVPLSRVPGEWDPSGTLWIDNAANGLAIIQFALTLQPGDTLTSVVVNLRGQSGVTPHAGVPGTKPLVTLIEVDFDGSAVTIAQEADPSLTQPAYDAAHLITLDADNLPHLVDGGKRLILSVRAEGGANASAGKTQILGIGFTGIARVIRNLTLHL